MYISFLFLTIQTKVRNKPKKYYVKFVHDPNPQFEQHWYSCFPLSASPTFENGATSCLQISTPEEQAINKIDGKGSQ